MNRRMNDSKEQNMSRTSEDRPLPMMRAPVRRIVIVVGGADGCAG